MEYWVWTIFPSNWRDRTINLFPTIRHSSFFIFFFFLSSSYYSLGSLLYFPITPIIFFYYADIHGVQISPLTFPLNTPSRIDQENDDEKQRPIQQQSVLFVFLFCFFLLTANLICTKRMKWPHMKNSHNPILGMYSLRARQSREEKNEPTQIQSSIQKKKGYPAATAASVCGCVYR